MYAGKTLVEFAHEVERREKAKRDFVAAPLQMSVKTNGYPAVLELDDVGQFQMTPLAHRQLGNHLNIPAKYYDRLLDQHPDLWQETTNTLLGRDGGRRMVRTLDNQVRAILSDRYRPIDNAQIAEAVLPVLQEQPVMRIESADVTDKRMYIKAVFPRLEAIVKRQGPDDHRRVDETVQAGLVVSNSEVGLGAVLVEPMIFRLICVNGLIMETAIRRTHVGRVLDTEGNGSQWFRDETVKADDRAMMLKLQDVVRGSLSDETFRAHVDKLSDATAEKLEGDPVKAVEEVSRRLDFTETEQGSVLRHLVDGGDLSRWGLVNAVTRTSQDASDYDRATDLERAGGRVLELDRSDWKAIAQAN